MRNHKELIERVIDQRMMNQELCLRIIKFYLNRLIENFFELYKLNEHFTLSNDYLIPSELILTRDFLC